MMTYIIEAYWTGYLADTLYKRYRLLRPTARDPNRLIPSAHFRTHAQAVRRAEACERTCRENGLAVTVIDRVLGTCTVTPSAGGGSLPGEGPC